MACLSAVKAVASQQFQILQQVEDQYPGITQLQTDGAGRIVI